MHIINKKIKMRNCYVTKNQLLSHHFLNKPMKILCSNRYFLSGIEIDNTKDVHYSFCNYLFYSLQFSCLNRLKTKSYLNLVHFCISLKTNQKAYNWIKHTGYIILVVKSNYVSNDVDESRV